jgi:hypothetical protein
MLFSKEFSEWTCTMDSDLPILDSSEQPDTTEGKTMAAQTKMTESEKTLMVTVLAGLVLVAGWTVTSLVMAFNGSIEMTNVASVTLATIATASTATFAFGVNMVRKAW